MSKLSVSFADPVNTTIASSADTHLERLRRAELDCVRQYFQPHMRVLEIGGGTGFQARILADWGCHVTSLDIGTRPQPARQYYDVSTYDGSTIPAKTNTFDVVFSSNVLEHVRDLGSLLAEIHRVLVPGGQGIHLVPSSTWRLWTSLAHYPYLVRRLVTRPLDPPSPREESGPASVLIPRGWVRRFLWAGAHGEYPSAISELGHFRRQRWCRLLREHGFETVRASGNGLFYTGYAIVPGLPLGLRRLMARGLGSSCHVIVTRS